MSVGQKRFPPRATPARSAALTRPAMMVSATPMPIWETWVSVMGNANRNSWRSSAVNIAMSARNERRAFYRLQWSGSPATNTEASKYNLPLEAVYFHAAPMLDVLYRNDDLLVVNKPANISLLADRSGAECYWDQLKLGLGADKPYLVHRLDKGTSGVLLVALNTTTQRTLTRAFHARSIGKFYLAWVVGELNLTATHIIDLPLKKGRKSRYRVAGQREHIQYRQRRWRLDPPHSDGHPSITCLRTLLLTSQRSLLLLHPQTGRSHQLRVHLAWIGYPILGDHLYGRPDHPQQHAPRLQLHCHRLRVPGFGTFFSQRTSQWLTNQGEKCGGR